MSILSCHLNLIYPPISNQEGVWLSKDIEICKYLKKSKLYMLVKREELKFSDIKINISLGSLTFRIYTSSFSSPILKINFNDLYPTLLEMKSSMLIEQGEKIIRIKKEDDDSLLFWATPDKMLFDFIQGRNFIKSEKEWDYNKFQSFELLYVGISKKNDSFKRLFKDAHKGRLDILSNEGTNISTARMTDELMILLFEVTWMNINSISEYVNDSQIDALFTYTTDEQAVVADAEKAFVSMLNSKYNKTKFNHYPEGKDGLFNKDLKGYSYSINYDLKLHTDTATFKGKYERYLDQDTITVIGDSVYLNNQ